MAKAKKSEEKPGAAHKSAAAAKKAPANTKETTAALHKPATKSASASHSAGAAKKPEKSAKSHKTSSASSTPLGAPLIDTNLAAQTAAAMVARKFVAGGGSDPQKSSESAAFKNLKDSVNKPSLGGLGGILGTGGGEKKFTPNFGGSKGGPAGGRNQTFGADVTRTGVPRRTNG
jgi:hypothetical protein